MEGRMESVDEVNWPSVTVDQGQWCEFTNLSSAFIMDILYCKKS